MRRSPEVCGCCTRYCNASFGCNLLKYAAILQVHISHVGTASFKGIKEPQVVMQLSSGRLACRTFPWDLPSTKADLVQRGRGLSYVIRMCDPLQASLQMTRRRSNILSYVPSPATLSQDGQD